MFISNFLSIGQQVLVLFILITVGFICGKKGILTESVSKKLTDIVLYVVTPCVMITAFQKDFSADTVWKILTAAATAAVILVVSIMIARLVIRDKNEGRRKVLQFSVIFSNCGFMSLPLQKELLGDDGWFYGSIFVVVFNVFVWTYGLLDMRPRDVEADPADSKPGSEKAPDKRRSQRVSFSSVLKNLALNPGLIGVTIAVILFLCRIRLPEILAQPVGHLANLNTPVPMLIIGSYLARANLKRAFTNGKAYLAMALRLLVIPIAATFAMAALGLDRTMVLAFVIACSAPAAATTTMFAAKFDRDVELSVSVVAATTLLSLITMPLVVSLAWTIL